MELNKQQTTFKYSEEECSERRQRRQKGNEVWERDCYVEGRMDQPATFYGVWYAVMLANELITAKMTHI